VTGCLEILNSGLVATASLDGRIRLWTANGFKLLTELQDIDKMTTAKGRSLEGVRSIDYTKNFGGYLLSTSYSFYINIWCPDSSISKSYSGRLEGHSAVVFCAKFFPRSQTAMSLDEGGTAKIWDLASTTCLQTLRVDG
jgi:WD40 repeat protein